jgi:NAD(P)H-dependent FMN reductase
MLVNMLNERNENVSLLDLGDLPEGYFSTRMYDVRIPEFQSLIDEKIAAAHGFIFVVPEYNGSIPGVLKLFIDTIPMPMFREKYAGIVGLSDGRAGNLRGQDHLTAVLHHLKMHVHYHKPKLSGITKSFDEQGNFTQAAYKELLEEHVALMIEYAGKG